MASFARRKRDTSNLTNSVFIGFILGQSLPPLTFMVL
jgi:hypothetical protein